MKRSLLLIVACLISAQLLGASSAKPGFRAGAATSNITPFLGGNIVGGFTPFPATNVHDELHARCLVLDDGKTRLAVVVCDLLAISRDVSLEARKLIQEQSGIPPEHVLVCAVHTHSACSAMGKAPLDEYHTFVARRIADLDPPFVAMMANGASGDVTSTDRREPEPRMEPYVKMRRIAEAVAGRVRAALAKAEYRGDITLAARYREPILARRHVTAEQIAWAKQTLAQPASKSGKADLPRIYAGRTMRLAESPESIPVPLQVFRIGPVCIGTMPTEVFCEIGLEFKKRSPIRPALLVSLSHGYLGYLPTPRHFALGGYETWIGTNQLQPQASEKMLDALLEMAAEVKK